jgi:tungstate transport system ATP-binding protein
MSILPLQLDDVCLVLNGRALVESISLRLTAGPRTIVLGPNGAGKSTLLRLCHGLVQPTAGAVNWAARGAAVRRAQAMVFQRPVLLRRSARANVAYALALAGWRGGVRRAHAEAALDRFGLGALGTRPARRLSGGEQQRLALARAWAIEPEVLFLDEPTANLDPAATRAVEEAIGAFQAAGVKIVMTTHDLGQARRLADEVVFLSRGRLLEHTPAEEFFHEPRSPEASAFLRGELVW